MRDFGQRVCYIDVRFYGLYSRFVLRTCIEKNMSHTPIVLVIEDDPYISKLIAVLLEEAYYQALIASTAAEGFALIEQHNQPEER